MKEFIRKTKEFFVAARILKKHRKKSSFLFLIKWGFIKAPRETSADKLPKQLLLLIGLKSIEVRQLTGIYQGAHEELGVLSAIAICTEIIQSRAGLPKTPRVPH